jgi:hypothetical protein
LGAAAGEPEGLREPESTMVLLDNDRTLAAYDEPDERWDALQEQMVSGELSHASPGGSIASVEWGGGVDAVLPAVLAALNTDGVCVVKNAMSAATAAAIREQMEAHNETYVLSALTMAQLTLQTSAAG